MVVFFPPQDTGGMTISTMRVRMATTGRVRSIRTTTTTRTFSTSIPVTGIGAGTTATTVNLSVPSARSQH